MGPFALLQRYFVFFEVEVEDQQTQKLAEVHGEGLHVGVVEVAQVSSLLYLLAGH